MGWKSAAVVASTTAPTRPPITDAAALFVPSVRVRARVQNLILVRRGGGDDDRDRSRERRRPTGPSAARRCQLWRNGFAGLTDGRGVVTAASDLVATTLAPHVRHFVLPRTVAAAAVCRV